VTAAHKKRRRRAEFLDFMNDIVTAYPDTAIHVVTYISTTRRRGPPGSIWFSILEGQSLRGASFTSVKHLREHIDAFIEAYNENAKPFAWTKSKVHQKRLKARFAYQ
jgi:hypothetical protein